VSMAVRCLLALTILVAAGCGGGAPSSSEPSGKQGEPTGLAVHTVASAGFSVAVPRSWKTVTSNDLGSSRIEQLKKDSILGPLLDALAKPNAPVRLITVDTAAHDAYRTNMSVAIEPAPDFSVEGLASRQYADEYERVNSADIVLGSVENELLSLPAGKAAHLSFRYHSPDAGRVLAQHQYQFISAGKVYSLICNALPQHEDDYLQTFLASARSVRLLP
jgi:hypothetical protein